MKIIYIGTSILMVYMILKPLKASYDSESDKFLAWPLVLGAAILSLIFHLQFTLRQVLWSFSILQVYC